MVITDLTRMQHGHVCIAGYDRQRNCVRPILPPPGIDETSLIDSAGKAIVFPFAVIDLDLLRHAPEPPHCEDWRYDPYTLKRVSMLPEQKHKEILKWSHAPSVADVFDQPIHEKTYVLQGAGTHSVGTITPKSIHEVVYEQSPEGAFGYRLAFYDFAEQYYRLKITDLTWTYFCHRRIAECGDAPAVAAEMTKMLKEKCRHGDVFLRIGLSRHWAKHPERCYLQVNGIHTFPDYLQGKTFADLR